MTDTIGSEPNIARFTDDQLAGCARILVGAFAGEPWHETWTKEAAARRLSEIRSTPGFLGLVALDDWDTLVGFLFGARETTARGGIFCVQWLCTSPGAEQRGVGSALLEGLESALGGLDASSSYLLTVNDPDLQTFYKRRGYRQEPGIVYLKRADPEASR